MGSAILEAGNRFLVVGNAHLVIDDREVAWAEPHIKPSPNVAWAVGRYVEADKPNGNKQLFATAQLQAAYPTISYTPANINHDSSRVVGFFAASEMLYPTGQTEGASYGDRPYVEALVAIWKAYFPEEYAKIKEASTKGALALSMEAIPTHLRCSGEQGCGKEFAYQGPQSMSYCKCLQGRIGDKELLNPQFIGGALVLPPARPAWGDADIYSLVAAEAASHDHSTAEIAEYQRILDNAMGLARLTKVAPSSVIKLGLSMAQKGFMAEGESMEMAKNYSIAERRELRKEGKTMPDLSFPVANAADLDNAVHALGRTSASKRARVISYLRGRAKALGIPLTKYPSLAG